MNSKALRWAIRVVAILALAVGSGAQAQAPTPVHLSGLINDYSPATISGKLVGPWVMHGTWSLALKGDSGLADFSAAMTMELSDQAISEGLVNVDDPSTRIPHTHHITLTDAMVSGDTSTCPVYSAPAPTNPGFMVSGPAKITGNGSPAPFSKGETVLSSLQVCVNGGSEVPFSNVTLVFGAPASGHFGMQAIHGVVRKTKSPDRDDRDRDR